MTKQLNLSPGPFKQTQGILRAEPFNLCFYGGQIELDRSLFRRAPRLILPGTSDFTPFTRVT